MTSSTMSICPCGIAHPLGVICEKGREILERQGLLGSGEETCTCGHDHAHGHEDHEHAHEHAHEHHHEHVHEAACGHEHAHEYAHEHHHDHAHEHEHDHDHEDGCCCHDHAVMEAIDYATLGEASDTRAVYRIVNMDCPMEEALIRKKLATVEGITGLEFNLMQRTLVVNHELPSTKVIEDALASIDMTPEPVLTGGETAQFVIADMCCPDEERMVRACLANVSGIQSLEFNLLSRTLTVRHAEGALPAISAALASLNMGARLLASREEAVIEAAPIPWKKLALATLLAAFSEIFHLVGEWGARPFGIDFSGLTIAGFGLLDILALVFSIIAISLAGVGTYKKGWLAVRNFNLNINALMSVAVTGAVLIGQFPEAAMVMVLFNISEAIEARSLDKARHAVKELLALAPEKAEVRQVDGTWKTMDIREVALGSIVRVRPGEKIALDGTVTRGHSTVNQAPITGESMPVEKAEGAQVFAGTINEQGSFEFEVTALASDSTLARIIHAVEEAQGSRAPMQRFVDSFAKYYTPAVFLAAILVALAMPLVLGRSVHESVYTALVLLVIGCPCALVISTPVSIVSGIAAATRSGILVKGGMFLEQGRLLKTIAFDKTGTITRGKPQCTDLLTTGSLPEAEVERLAASIAARSDHPVSVAIAERARARGGALHEVDELEALPGEGVCGKIDGRTWHLGSHRMVEHLGKCSQALEEKIFALETEGKSVTALVGENGVEGLFAVADTVRETSVDAVRDLKSLGVRTVMLTGDNAKTAAVIASQVGVNEYRADMLPEDKLNVVMELEKDGPVGMVGDGINDAPALARAQVGFAMAKGGTDTAIETADVAIMDDDLRKVARFVRLSRSTYGILVENITLALAIKALFFALTLAGAATMWMAVFADVGTSLLVVGNGLRALKK